MVPQQYANLPVGSASMSAMPTFGSQLVDKNSSTPYTDATKVSVDHKNCSAKNVIKTKKVQKWNSARKSYRSVA